MSLSFKKLVGLIQKQSYIITSVWTNKERIELLELRTPKLQKTFIVNVPEKYKLTYDTDLYKRVSIVPTISPPIQKQLDYINELRGSIMNCDLISLTSKFVCIYKNNGSYLHYVIGDQDVAPQLEEKDELSTLIEDATKIIGNVHLPSISEDVEEIAKPIDNKNIVNPIEDAEEPIELEFIQDSEEENDEESEEDIPSILEHSKPSKTSSLYRKDNSIPPNLEDVDIMRGLIYYCTSLSEFYKSFSTEDYETKIVTIYDVLNDNDKNIRESRIENITELFQKLNKKIKDELELFQKKEDELKNNILALSTILEKIERLRPSKGGPELEKIYTQTRAAIYEANIDLLKERESIDDYFESIESVLDSYLS